MSEHLRSACTKGGHYSLEGTLHNHHNMGVGDYSQGDIVHGHN